ncbi:hypothetical protein E0L36_23145 [Streptomyces sp. AJS327]|uniref:hypothetical protein n=1 Tax=Streptomyces sp. AJS327 TaxID=2545265 RepID=UPI0015DD8C40|nr:hypothetical protein [Streptomyces sp. AJS327]MBA0053656.1 hypothetical protein [Streptomyces sp. AJS327]
MNALDTSTVLYLCVGLGAVTLLAAWIVTARIGRDSGFATKRRLKRQLTAQAVLRATELRPSLTSRTRSDRERT